MNYKKLLRKSGVELALGQKWKTKVGDELTIDGVRADSVTFTGKDGKQKTLPLASFENAANTGNVELMTIQQPELQHPAPPQLSAQPATIGKTSYKKIIKAMSEK